MATPSGLQSVAKNTVPHLNQLFFAAKIVKDHGWVYEATEKAFYQYDPASGLWRNVRAEEALDLVADNVQAFLCDYPSGGDVLAREHNCSTMKSVLKLAEGKALETGFFDVDVGPPLHSCPGTAYFAFRTWR